MKYTSYTLWLSIKPYVMVFDRMLLSLMFLIMGVGLFTIYSAGLAFPHLAWDQLRNMAVTLCVMWLVANLPPQTWMRLAPFLYVLGMALLIAVAFFGVMKNGSRRWLNIGIVVQPSEMMKIVVPLMLAWYFQQREGSIGWRECGVASLLLVLPIGFIIKQPDLDTALLVCVAGMVVIFLAGLSWRIVWGLVVTFLASLPIIWHYLHDYQKSRILMLLDPMADPLGKGFQIIQSTIAIGSGGVLGKGWLRGTQTHLEFIPERTTDFIFAVFSEEWGLLGAIILLILYGLFFMRGLTIAAQGATLFARLLGGSITTIFFTYMFVNMGMVSGIIPVVGVPLPMVSYGGTALVTLGFGVGILMSIHHHKKLVQS